MRGPTVGRDAPTVIVGAGHAGLALSRCLTAVGVDHVLLERGRTAERWRSERWDSFHLLTPNWHTRLPGFRYAGEDPDGFLDRDGVVSFLEDYARSFHAPVVEDTTVHAARPAGAGWIVETDRGAWEAGEVVVATGPHQRPGVPALSRDLPAAVHQLHARDYRRPDALPPGGVVVVGAGPTGQQLAVELARAGRHVVLAVGRHRTLPRRYRDRDAFWWLEQLGELEQVVPPGRDGHRPEVDHPVLAAGRDLGLDEVVRDGVQVVGRLQRADGWRLHLADDLPRTYREATDAAARFRAEVDAFVTATGLPVPPARPPRVDDDGWVTAAPRQLDLRAEGIRTVLWATGYRRDFRWIDAPVLGRDGEPNHRRGLTAAPGLAFLGLSNLHRQASASIDGAAVDARYLARWIEQRRRDPVRSRRDPVRSRRDPVRTGGLQLPASTRQTAAAG
jgi:putative flavoprotein involved in K+ transport